MKTWAVVPVLAVGSVSFGRAAAQQSSQPTQDEVPTTTHGKEKKSKKHGKGTAAEIARCCKGAVDLATLHPIDAGAAFGSGAVKAGEDVTVGSIKGVEKVSKGVGHAVKKVF